MSSRRFPHSRSPSRSRSPRHRSRSHSPSRERRPNSPDRHSRLPGGVEPIAESDYFLKSAEFRVWLKDEKRKYFDELSGDKARSYFRKFVKAWNKGKLPRSLYSGVDSSTISATSQTAYKWSFASNKERVDPNAIKAVRESVGAATNHSSKPQPTGRVLGPVMPSVSDLVLAREAAAEMAHEEKGLKRKRDKAETRDRLDEIAPKEVGREGMLEKKRAKKDGDKAFREGKEDQGLEVDEATLMGGGDSFKAHIARRDARKRKADEKRMERDTGGRERQNAIKEKDKATMDMLQQLAKQRFG